MPFPDSDGQTPSYYLLSTSKDLPTVAEDFLLAVFPFLKSNSRPGAYKALGNIKTEAIKFFCYQSWRCLKPETFANRIFIALKGYAPTDVQICDATIQFYHRTRRLRERSTSLLLELLSEHPSHRTRAFAFEILKKKQ